MNKKLAALAIGLTILILLGGIQTSFLYGTTFLHSKSGYSFAVAATNDWWDCNWSYAKKITIDHTKVQADQANFPVLLYEGSDADLAAYAQNNGNDIIFVDRWNVTQYHHELERFDGDTGELWAWVNITSLSSTQDTIVYMYYGNPTCANQQHVTETWDSDYVMVHHFAEPSGTTYDSTLFNNDGTSVGGVTQNVLGKIDRAVSFDGTTGYITTGTSSSLNITDQLTLEGWVQDPPISDETGDKTIHSGKTIDIIDAGHLDINRNFISSIYNETFSPDTRWSEPIHNGEFVRVSFARPLGCNNDITIVARSTGLSQIEVYAKNDDTLIATFPNITCARRYQIYLDDLNWSSTTFDLKTIGDQVEYDYIVDPTGWVSPTGYNDPSGQWGSETKVYDDNTATFATINTAAGWLGFLELTLTSPIYCDRVRVFADFGGVADRVDIDVYNSTGWIDKFNGTISNCAWTELSFAAETNVSKARFRYHFTGGGWIYWFYEFDFWQGQPIVLPTATTLNATSIDETTAILQGNVSNDGGEPCQYRFQYGSNTSYGNDTAWTGSKITNDDFTLMIQNLTLGHTYQYRVQVKNSIGMANGSNKNFTTSSPSVGWVTPTSHYDPNSQWSNETNIYDDDTDTYARSYHDANDPDGQWSFYIYMNHSMILSDKIRFFARGLTGDSVTVDQADLDVIRGGVWVDVYQGSFTDKQWVIKNFTQGNVVSARIRFHVNVNNGGMFFELYEFDFNKSRAVPTITNPGPTNRSWGVTIKPWMNITVNNPDGNNMTLNWYSNSSGSWQLFGRNSSIGNGTYHQRNNNFSTNNTKYWWKVTVTDGTDTNTSVYYFSTTDNTKPSSSITAITPYWKKSTLTITATASDTGWSGLKNVTLYYRFSTDNSSWGGWVNSGLVDTDPWVAVSWSFSFSNGSGYYQLYSIAKDNATNTETTPGSADARCGYENTAPSSSVSVIAPYWKTSSPQTFSGTASDTGPSGLKNVTLRYRYRATNASNWGGWVNSGLVDTDPWVAVSWSFSFSNGSGHYEFYSIANDNATNAEAAPGSADTRCAYDNLAPTSSLANGRFRNSTISTYEWNGAEGRHPAAIRLGSSEYYLIASEGDLGGAGATNDGWLFTIRVWSTNGTIRQSLVDSWEYDASDGYYPSICLVNGSSNIYAITYEDAGSLARKIITTRVWSTNGSMQKTILDTLSLYRSTITSYSKILNVNGNIYAVAYVNNTDGDGRLATCYITSSGDIGNAVNDTLEFNSSDALNPQMCPVDSDTIAIVYDGGTAGGNDGYLVTYNISSTGDITNTYADQWEYDPTMGTTPNIFKVWDDTESSGVNRFVIGYEDTNSDLYVKTCTINDAGLITKSWTDTQAIDTTNGDYCNFALLGFNSSATTKLMLVGFSGEGADGYVSSFDVTNAGLITTEIDSQEFDAADCISRPRLLDTSNSSIWVIVYEGTGNDGWSCTLSITTNGLTYWKTASPFTLNGDAVDTGASGLKNVTLWYRYRATNTSSWGGWVSWSNAGNPDADPWVATSWSFNFSNGTGHYQVYSIARDNVSNTEAAPGSADVWFGYDNQVPSSSINPISGYWKTASPTTITATAADAGSGVKNVTSYYRFSSNNATWGGWVNAGTDTASPWSWSFSFSNDSGYYEFYSIAKDNLTLTESTPGSADARCAYDHTAPSSLVTPIIPYWRTSTPININASASDSTSGVKNVTLYYRFSSNNASWGGWVSTGVDSASPWSWSFSFSNGSGFYQFYSSAKDNATNAESAPGSADARCGCDTTAPSSSVDAIAPYWEKTIATITATASDAVSGMKNVTLYYRFSSNNASWGGWVSGGIDTASPWSWSFGFSNGSGYYQFYSIAKDNATNGESAPGSADTICGYDNQAPSSSVNAISEYWKSSSPLTITAITSDTGPSGLKNVTLYYRYRATNASSWGGNVSFGMDTDPWIECGWSFTFPNGSGHYEFFSVAKDNATNEESTPGSADTRCGYDTTAPSSSVDTIFPYWQKTSPFTITATVNDALSGLKNVTLYYRYRATNTSSWGGNMSFGVDPDPWVACSWNFTFPNGTGQYQFYSRAIDNATNTESAPENADANGGFDDEEPASSVTTISQYSWMTSPVTLNATASDTGSSGLHNVTLYYRNSTDNSTWTSWVPWINLSNPDSDPWVATSWDFNFPSGIGYYEFYSIAYDNATNQESAPGVADARCYYNPTTMPKVKTNGSTGIKTTNATIWGYLLDDGYASTTCGFWWDTDSGIPYAYNHSVGVISEGNTFSYNISELIPGQLYYYRTWAYNSRKFNSTSDEFKMLTKPLAPPAGGFNAHTNNSTTIYLTWSKGTGANTTYIERNTTQNWMWGQGIVIYNSSGTSYEDTGLSPGMTYYYRAWSFTHWNPSQWSDENTSTSNITNHLPLLTNPGPSNGSSGINIRPQMNITVTDLDEQTMTILWYSNSSGSWQLFGLNNSVGNGTYHQRNTNFSNYATKYWWNISVSDKMDTNTSWYCFTTLVDTIKPNSNVTHIAPYWGKTSPLVITASASDAGGSGLKNVTLYYYNSSDNTTWYGPWKFGVVVTPWLGVTWSFTFPDGIGFYRFYSKATDNATNQEDLSGNDTGCGYDTIAPQSSLDVISSFWHKTSPLTLTATANDALSGVKNVTVYYRFSSNNVSWGGYVSGGVDPASPWSWSFSFSNGSGYYQFYTIAKDNATNIESAPGSADSQCGYDAQAPTSSVTAISTYWKTSSPQSISGTGSDSGSSGLKNATLWYRYRATNASGWGGWMNSGVVDTDPWLAISWSFTFPNGTGHYQFYSIAADNATNTESAPGGADTACGYDTAAPTSSVDTITPYWKKTSPLTLTITVSDTGASGLKNVTLYFYNSTNNNTWRGPWRFDSVNTTPWNNPRWTFTYPNGTGYYRFYSIAYDNATNKETFTGNDTRCGYDTQAPSSSVNTMTPYAVVSSPKTINATASDDLSGVINVTLWYSYSTDNSTWWNNNWLYRKKITIDPTKVSTTLLNFPVLISLTDANLTSKAQSDADDIVFTNAAGTKLNHEIEKYNSSTGNLIAWVNVTRVSSSAPTIIYMYYGNSTCSSQQNKYGTWNGNYLMVQHMEETSGTIYDSTSHGYNATPYNSPVSATCKIDGSINFTGSNYAVVSSFPHNIGTGDFTWSNWVRTPSSFNNPNPTMTCGVYDPAMYTRINGNTNWGWYDSSYRASGSTLNTNTIYYIVCVRASGVLKFYQDGVLLSTIYSYPDSIPNTNFTFGRSAGAWPGKNNIDETRISNVALNSSWINTSYLNQNSPSTFYSIGPEEKRWRQWNDATNPDTAGPWSWNFNFPNGSGYYKFYSIANDTSGNKESVPASADSMCRLVESTKPTSSVKAISPYWKTTSPLTITGDASDTGGSGLKNVTLYYYNSSNNNTWYGPWNNGVVTTPWISLSWSFTFPKGIGYYRFYSRAGDNDSNIEDPPVINDTKCGYDTTAPSSSVSTISLYWKTSSPQTISGTASDTGPSGLKNSTLWYRYRATNTSGWGSWTRWSNAGNPDATPWPPSGVTWSFNFPSGAGHYEFYSITADNATNTESAPGSADARCAYDATAPSSSVDIITPYWKKVVTTITATATDATSGVKNVTLYYRFSGNNASWGGYVSAGADTASPWSWSFSFVNGSGYYQFYSIAKDNATNTEAAPGTADARCGYDTTAPSSSIDAITPYWKKTSPLTITATASDGLSGVKNVTLYYRFSNNNASWGGWVSGGVDTASPWSWSFSFSNGSGYYQFYSIAKDNATNTESAPGSADTSCGYDVTAPSSSVDTIALYWQKTSPLTINVTAFDALSGVKNVTLYYRFSSDNSSWGGYVSVGVDTASPWSWSFSFVNGSGYYQFYSIAKDNATNTEAAPGTADARCGYDAAAPSSSVNAIAPYWKKAVTTISATASDALSGVKNVTLFYRFSGNNASWGGYVSAGVDVTSPWSWSFPFTNGSGYYQFYSIAKDNATNAESVPGSADANCGYDTTVPSSSVDVISSYWKTTSPILLTATANDTLSGVKNVTVYYRFSSNNASWGGYISGGVDIASPWSWSFSFTNGSGYYQFYSIAKDNATNVESASGSADALCGYDGSSPSSSVNTITPYWNKTTATITATASDATSGVKNVTLYYRFSSNNASWGGYVGTGVDAASPWSWDFPFSNGSGYYQFYSIAKDNATNAESPPGTADVICGFDGQTPSSSVNPISLYLQITSPLAINAMALENGPSGLRNVTLKYRFSSNNLSWGGWTSFGINTSPWSSISWSFTFSNWTGYYEFYTIACDNATNQESAPGSADARCYYLPITNPTVTTNASTDVEETNATVHGYLQNSGGENCTVRFQYGTTTNYGTNTTNQRKTTGQTFQHNITGLSPGQWYHYRAYANNTMASATGADLTFLTKPNPPVSLTAQTNTSTTTYLTWTKGTGANTTRIQRKIGGYPTSIADGTMVYNGTEIHTEDVGLTPGTTYYYRAWSFTSWSGCNQWSDTYASASTTTKQVPLLSNEQPTNGSIGIALNTTLSLQVNHPSGYLMNITWYWGLNSSCSDFIGSNISVVNGTYSKSNDGNFSSNSQTYYWKVTINDGHGEWTNATYHFATVLPNKQVLSKGRSAYAIELDPSGTTLYGYVKETSVQTNIDPSWHYVSVTYNSAQLALYQDGVLKNSTSLSGAIPTNANPVLLGDFLSGKLDEVRVSKTARSPAWINTTYMNTNNPTTFATFGSQVGLLSTWTYRKSITINMSQVNGTLTDFPILISITDTDLKNNALANGYDILFTNTSVDWTSGSTLQKLDHEIERYDSSTGELIAWVRIPRLSSTTTAVIYMYYGNNLCTANRQNPTGVWQANFMGVWHMNQLTGGSRAIKDSTLHYNNGTDIHSPTLGAVGKVGYAISFDGTDDWVDVPTSNSLNLTSALTLEVWGKPTGAVVNTKTYMAKRVNGSSTTNYMIQYENGFQFYIYSSGWRNKQFNTTPPADTWSYTAVSFDQSNAFVYYNATLDTANTSLPYSLVANAGQFRIGTGNPSISDQFFKGTLDEVRVSNTVRNASWIRTTYNTIHSPSSFLTFGPQKTRNVAPTQQSPSPSNQTTGISLNPPLRIRVNDTNADALNVTFRINASGSWVTIGTNTSVTNGTYQQTASTMNYPNVTYYWSVNVTDGLLWSNATYRFRTIPEVNFSATSSDGWISNTSSSYLTARNASTGSVSAGASDLVVGQRLNSSIYTIYRGFLFFNTSAIPDGATITATTLRLYGETDVSTQDFTIVLQNGQPMNPSDPLQNINYFYGNYSGNGGFLNTSSFSVIGYNSISLNNSGKSWINKTGITKLCLRSSRDINAVLPMLDEFIRIYTSEQGDGYIPILQVVYTP